MNDVKSSLLFLSTFMHDGAEVDHAKTPELPHLQLVFLFYFVVQLAEIAGVILLLEEGLLEVFLFHLFLALGGTPGVFGHVRLQR